MKKIPICNVLEPYVPLSKMLVVKERTVRVSVQKTLNGRLVTDYESKVVNPADAFKDYKCSDFAFENLAAIGNESFFQQCSMSSTPLHQTDAIGNVIPRLNSEIVLSEPVTPAPDAVPSPSSSEPPVE